MFQCLVTMQDGSFHRFEKQTIQEVMEYVEEHFRDYKHLEAKSLTVHLQIGKRKHSSKEGY